MISFCFHTVLLAALRAATSQGRVTAGTPQRSPRPFRSTTTHWGPCTSPDRPPPLLSPPPPLPSTFTSHSASLSVRLWISRRAMSCRCKLHSLGHDDGSRLRKDVRSQRGVQLHYAIMKPANCFCAPAHASVSPSHLLCCILNHDGVSLLFKTRMSHPRLPDFKAAQSLLFFVCFFFLCVCVSGS